MLAESMDCISMLALVGTQLSASAPSRVIARPSMALNSFLTIVVQDLQVVMALVRKIYFCVSFPVAMLAGSFPA